MKLSKYLENNQIKENLEKKELLNLQELLERAKEANLKTFGSRTRECYLWEIEKRLTKIA